MHMRRGLLLLAMAALLAACASQRQAATSQMITYDTSPMAVVIQVARVGGNIQSGPLLTLYGDGRVTFEDATSFQCRQGMLSATQVQDTLRTVIYTDHFFGYQDGKYYGKQLNPDVAAQQIMVHANGTQRSVLLGSPDDADSRALAGIVAYVLQIRPAQAVACG